MGYRFRHGKLGGGGFVTDIDISSDGLTRLHTTDVHGAYRWNSTTLLWINVMTGTSLPQGDNPLGGFGESNCCYSMRLAPSEPTTIYAVFFATTNNAHCTMYKSTDRGVNWIKTNLPVSNMTVQTSTRFYGPKMAVDPLNKDHVIVANTAGAYSRTTNGGTSFSTITDLSSFVSPAICFDKNDPNNVYACASTGDKGVWRSIDNGATFSQMTGGPLNVWRIASAIDGTIYFTEAGVGGDNAWKLVGTTFTKFTVSHGSGWHSIACDPNDANRVTLGYSAGNITTSLDAGATWSSFYDNAPTRVANDIPWLAWTNEDSMSNGNMVYDPIVANKLWFAEGIGIWTTTPPLDATKPVWTSVTAGNDELIVNDVIVNPVDGTAILSCWDRALFRIANPEVFPSVHYPYAGTNGNAIQHAGILEYASSDPNFLLVCITKGKFQGLCKSTDGGLNWSKLDTQPPNGSWGNCAALTPLKFIHVSHGRNVRPHYTADGGATWNLCTFPDEVPTSGSTGWGFSFTTPIKGICADRSNGNFYAVNYVTKNVYVSKDGGASFILIANDIHSGNAGSYSRIQTVHGYPGYLFMNEGAIDSIIPNNLVPHISVDGGVNWTIPQTVTECTAWGFGKAAPGSPYPTIIMQGCANGHTVVGIYLSTDLGTKWTLLTRAPADSVDRTTGIAGDPNVYGRFYLTQSGSGFLYSAFLGDGVSRYHPLALA